MSHRNERRVELQAVSKLMATKATAIPQNHQRVICWAMLYIWSVLSVRLFNTFLINISTLKM